MTEQILKQDVMIDGQQVTSIATPDIVTNHVSEAAPHTPRTIEVDPTKLQVMQNAVAKIEKAFGHCAIMRMNDESVEDVDVIPTGSIGLDRALGVGGYPRGRIIEIYGPEASGKTTLALHAIAQAQQMGGIAAYIDAEHAFDRNYAEAVGVNTRNLWISQPDNGEQALEIADQLIRSAAIDVIVIDSVAALTPKAEIEGEMGESKMGLQARLMSQALRKLTATIAKTRTCCIFINQLREKLGVMFGNPETTTGGNALKFYSSVRLDIRRLAHIHPSARPSSTSSTATASAARANSWTWVSRPASSRRAARGSAGRTCDWAKVARPPSSTSPTTPTLPTPSPAPSTTANSPHNLKH